MSKQKEPGKKKQSAVRLDPALNKSLKHLAVDREVSFNSLVEEGIIDLLKKYQTKKNKPY